MQSKIQTWDNSLVIRIPVVLAKELGLHEELSVELSTRDGALEVTPVRELRPDLDVLLSRISDDNIHAEISTGVAVGQESW